MEAGLSSIYSWIKNITFFILLCEFISCLINNAKYKKYFNFVTGLLFVLMITGPVLSLTGGAENLKEVFDREYVLYDTDDITFNPDLSDYNRDNAILVEYKNHLKKQVEMLVGSYGYMIGDIDFNIKEDNAKSDYGAINSVKMSVYKEDYGLQNDISDRRVLIEDILIEHPPYGKDNENNITPDKLMLKKVISDFYHLDINNINITIWEEQNGG